MLETLIVLLSFYGICFAFKETELCSPIRRFLFNLEKIGPFFIKMFECPMCLGSHTGAIIYLLYCIAHGSGFSFAMMLIWSFASGALNLIMQSLLDLIHRKSSL